MNIQQYSELGYDLVPLLGKRPLAKWKDPVPIEVTLRLVRERGAKLGFHTGRSRIIVADADSDEAQEFIRRELPESPMHARTQRGIHVYYRAPLEIIPLTHRFRGMALDILAGSSIAAEREWLGDVLPVNQLPEFPAGLIKKEVQEPIQQILCGDREQLIRRAQAYIARIFSIEHQGGNSQLFRACCATTQKFGLTFAEAWPLIVGWNLTNARPSWDEKTLKRTLERSILLKGA